MKRHRLFSRKNKGKKGNRDWVKNAVIIFLAVMLVLTFFSNTIMNFSLPEVAAQYPQSTTITTKIRGSGTVEACQTYDVIISDTRTVATVDVKAGDVVKAGDTLLTLDEQESQELQDARLALETLETEYEKMTVSKGDQTHADTAALQQLRDAVTNAETDLQEAQNYESNLAWYQQQVTSAQSGVTSAQQALNSINTEISLLQNEKDSIKVINSDYLAADQRVSTAQNAVDQLELQEPAYSDNTEPAYSADLAVGDDVDSTNESIVEPTVTPMITPSESEEHKQWQISLNAAEEELSQAITDRDQLYNSLTLDLDQQIVDANERRIWAEADLSNAQTYVESANNALAQFQNEHPNGGSVDAAEAALLAAQHALASAEATAEDQTAEKAYEGSVEQIELAAKEQELQNARDLVADLEEQAGPAKIVSRYPGIVQTVNIAAGDKTTAETPLIVVELTEKGYTLKASVTKEQARALREGMSADITNLWNSDITMTLESITTDKENAASGRVLTFSVQGENVTVGQQLSFSVGDKNASYDVVVPSAAIHTDADGSFVYTVQAKSSPLGNRYVIRKTAVEVIASDDSQSAVSGTLSTADFVITTATVPLEPGDQVRIAE